MVSQSRDREPVDRFLGKVPTEPPDDADPGIAASTLSDWIRWS
jgi:hypothetical protein